MTHRVLDAELVARAAELAATGLSEEIGKALGVSDRDLYFMLRDAKEGHGELEVALLEALAAGVGAGEP